MRARARRRPPRPAPRRSPGRARRARGGRPRRCTVAMTTLVSRTAATDAAGASRRAARTSAYARNIAIAGPGRPAREPVPDDPGAARGGEAGRVGDARRRQRDLEVRDRRRVMEPGLVDHRVRGDAGRDAERHRRRGPTPSHVDAADEHDADGDDRHAGHLERRRLRRRRDDGDHQDEDGRGAAGDRVDDREVVAPVRRGQEREVGQLGGRRGADVGDGRPLDPPRERGDRRERRGADQDRRGAGPLGIPGPGDEDVPAGVKRRCGEGEREGRGGHRAHPTRRTTGATLVKHLYPVPMFQAPAIASTAPTCRRTPPRESRPAASSTAKARRRGKRTRIHSRRRAAGRAVDVQRQADHRRVPAAGGHAPPRRPHEPHVLVVPDRDLRPDGGDQPPRGPRLGLRERPRARVVGAPRRAVPRPAGREVAVQVDAVGVLPGLRRPGRRGSASGRARGRHAPAAAVRSQRADHRHPGALVPVDAADDEDPRLARASPTRRRGSARPSTEWPMTEVRWTAWPRPAARARRRAAPPRGAPSSHRMRRSLWLAVVSA